ncbi:hypothetical protein chiPu_0018883 [Chiloscyllium punctatum]|uniref:Reverse transcriptase domain-containing protein n=1 Tax=Chiloscyllium punctatum TaxID=137246 RepID=A0A401RQA4_CHIPU|nr:hypothetical protein [Chiloscyllium punctatum]
MAQRLSETVEIDPRQKGFRAATPGCNENIVVLENIIKGAKYNGKDLAVIFVDLAKVLDSVGHKLLIKSLQRAAPLRPRQRLEILKIHAKPRLYFHLILTEASQATLIKLDQIIHNATKEFLHLPPHTTDGVLYASNRNGSLGIPKLEVQIPSLIVRKREALDMSSDVVIRASFQYKGENNTETVAGLRELMVLKEIENFQPSSGEGEINPMTAI